MNFALIGVGGYIAPRHLEAIKTLGHKLVVAFDVNDSVGVLDRYFPDCRFFTQFERFEDFVSGLKNGPDKIDYVAICSPNYLHAPHIKFALRQGASAICEKPLVLTVAELDEIGQVERDSGQRVYTVLQLRVHDAILALKEKVSRSSGKRHQVDLSYMTSRGQWYHESWKGDVRKSGGLSTNIGVHFFDMLTWIFGPMTSLQVSRSTPTLEEGTVSLEHADVRWMLTIDRSQLPGDAVRAGKTTFRSIKIDGEEFEFSEGFTELHQRVYADILAGRGYGLQDAHAALAIVEKIRGSR
ncbi:MAG: Gfo/Idh/MocA family oxidoreductase [Bdellovibrionaceae bacterium]|nr:Gfo/Idh/MocA family oxidoreductase [Pseudobdellovibrionaceae bacterium]